MPKDRKQYSKTRPIELPEFELEKAWWAQRAENEYAWRVPAAEIEARNYNLDIKNPHTDEDEYGDPAKLLSHYQERLRLVAELKAELKAALLK